jgi:hypothetical protein
MTERTTTEMLASALENADEFSCSAIPRTRLQEAEWACEALNELNSKLLNGSPLPKQWPQAREIEELRAKVAKYEWALGCIVRNGLDIDTNREIAREALKP